MTVRGRRPGYRLLDAGDGRRLEAFGSRIVDRPQPGADWAVGDGVAWEGADLRFDKAAGWRAREPALLEPWLVAVDGLTLELRAMPSGQVGLFPEHLANLGWLRQQVGRLAGRVAWHGRTPSVLNLFAYTGLASLVMALSGGSVVHVDASRPAVAWARRNASLSGLGEAPIRWLVDGAEAFVERELRRGRRYEGLVLDPPSWGHGAGGRRWRLDDRLPALLGAASRLVDDSGFVLLTGHSIGLDPEALERALRVAFGSGPGILVEAGELALEATSGVRLALGSYARLTR